jgi:hypothetical protein
MKNIKEYAVNFLNTWSLRVFNMTLTKSGSVNGVITVDGVRSVAQDKSYSIPISYPSGFFSIPNNNSIALINNLGVGQSNQYVSNYLYASLDPRVIIQNQGENALFSNGVYVNLLNTGITIKYGSSGNQTCSLASGEDLGTILADVILQIQNLQNQLNSWQNQFVTFHSEFTSHTHNGVTTGSGTSGGTTSSAPNPSSITLQSTMQRDLNFVQNLKHLINNNGVTPVS